MDHLSELAAHLKPLKGGPILGRINGCGFTFLGWLRDELLEPHMLKMHWFTVLWIPIVPLGVYVVDRGDVDQYQIYRRLSLWRFHKIYWGRLTRFYLTVASESILWMIAIIAALGFALLVVALLSYGMHEVFL